MRSTATSQVEIYSIEESFLDLSGVRPSLRLTLASDIYTEGLTRTNVTQGPTWLTFTPLLGASEVVRSFLLEKSPDRHITQMTINGAEHYTEEARAKIIASYPVHEAAMALRRGSAAIYARMTKEN